MNDSSFWNQRKEYPMKHLQRIQAGHPVHEAEGKACSECQTSCQSACKTSCTVANQPCENDDRLIED